MTDARYIPRDYCSPFYDFGTSEPVKWITPDSPDNALIRRIEAARRDASVIQHAIARQVRTRVKELRSSVVDVAHACGMKPERLRRVLRGEVPMRLDDLTLLEYVLGGLDVPGGAPLRELTGTRLTLHPDTTDR